MYNSTDKSDKFLVLAFCLLRDRFGVECSYHHSIPKRWSRTKQKRRWVATQKLKLNIVTPAEASNRTSLTKSDLLGCHFYNGRGRTGRLPAGNTAVVGFEYKGSRSLFAHFNRMTDQNQENSSSRTFGVFHS